MTVTSTISHFTRSSSPFATRGESLSSADIAATFIVPETFFFRVQDRFHHLIEGDLGSGKTMLLRAMSTPVRAAMADTNADLVRRMYRDRYLGIYLSFATQHTSIFRVDERNTTLRNLFILWLNARAAQELLFSVNLVLGQAWASVAEKHARNYLGALATALGAPHDYLAASESIAGAVHGLGRMANEARQSVGVEGTVKLSADSAWLEKAVEDPIAPQEFLDLAVQSLRDVLPQIDDFLPLFLLLDYYEELPDALQRVTNGFFSWREQPLFFTKACSLPGGVKTNKTLAGRDIVRPDEVRGTKIHWDWMSDDYRHFCRDVASRHLSRFSEIHPDVEVTTSADTLLPGIHPLEELAAVVGEVDASRVMERVKKHLPQKGTPELSDFRRVLFFEIHNRGAAKKYSGLDEFAALSSGNIRTFMRLCEGAFDLAFERTAIGAYKAIAPDVQDIAARQVAREWLTSRIPTTTSVYEGEVRHLVESFARMLKERYTRGPQECVWRRLRVTPKDNMPVSLSADVQESVRSAVQAGILKSIPSPADAFVFEVAPVFAPEWDLSFELAGTLDVQPAALEHMMTLFLKN